MDAEDLLTTFAQLGADKNPTLTKAKEDTQLLTLNLLQNILKELRPDHITETQTEQLLTLSRLLEALK